MFLLRLKILASFLGLVVTFVIPTLGRKGQKPSRVFYSGFGHGGVLQYLKGRYFLLLCLNLSMLAISNKICFSRQGSWTQEMSGFTGRGCFQGGDGTAKHRNRSDFVPFLWHSLSRLPWPLSKTSQIHFYSEFIHSYEELPNGRDAIAP